MLRMVYAMTAFEMQGNSVLFLGLNLALTSSREQLNFLLALVSQYQVTCSETF